MNARREFARQMVVNDLVRQLEVFLGFFGVILSLYPQNAMVGGRIAGLAVPSFPVHRVSIITPTISSQNSFTFSSGLDFELMAEVPFEESVEVDWASFFSLEISKRSRNCRFSSCNRSHSAKASVSLCSMGVEAFTANSMSEYEPPRDAKRIC